MGLTTFRSIPSRRPRHGTLPTAPNGVELFSSLDVLVCRGGDFAPYWHRVDRRLWSAAWVHHDLGRGMGGWFLFGDPHARAPHSDKTHPLCSMRRRTSFPIGRLMRRSRETRPPLALPRPLRLETCKSVSGSKVRRATLSPRHSRISTGSNFGYLVGKPKCLRTSIARYLRGRRPRSSVPVRHGMNTGTPA